MMTNTTKIATNEKATATRVVELGVQDGDGERQFVGVGRASSLARRHLIRTRSSIYCHRSVAMAVVPTLGRSRPATGSRKTTADTSSKSKYQTTCYQKSHESRPFDVGSQSSE